MPLSIHQPQRVTCRSAPHEPAGQWLHRAYTLVEVLVVVAILGIAGMIVVPHMLKGGTLTVQAAGRAVIADLLYAQNEAIAQQEPRRLAFDVDNNRYQLTDAAGVVQSATWKGAEAGNYIIDFDNDSRFTGVKIVSATFGDDAFIEYDDLGTPSSGGSVDLLAAGMRYRIAVAPFTGRVTINQVDE